MNIFVLDLDPAVAAQMQCDKHVVKMTLESAQLLCTVKTPAPYRPTHRNHPPTVWARHDANWLWLYSHFQALLAEYTFRYGKTHLCETKVLPWAAEVAETLVPGDLTPFAQVMPEKYRGPDAVEAYRAFYKAEKTFAVWKKGREAPYWWSSSSPQD